MVGYFYRINTPTLGIHTVDGNHVSVMIPAGAVISIVNGPLDGTRLVDVMWDGVPAMMFTVDIRERGTKINLASG